MKINELRGHRGKITSDLPFLLLQSVGQGAATGTQPWLGQGGRHHWAAPSSHRAETPLEVKNRAEKGKKSHLSVMKYVAVEKRGFDVNRAVRTRLARDLPRLHLSPVHEAQNESERFLLC